MNVPTTIPWLPNVSPALGEGVTGQEFDEGKWSPKHPGHPPAEYPFRHGHEFVDGHWVAKPMSVESSYLGLKLGSAMLQQALASRAGRVLGPNCGFQCFPDDPYRLRLPDASFIRAERVTAEVRSSGNCPIAPDIAAEVVSPNDAAETLAVKVHQYLSAGVQLVWLIFPRARTVWILRSDRTAIWLTSSDVLTGESTFPDFSISLQSFFNDDSQSS